MRARGQADQGPATTPSGARFATRVAVRAGALAALLTSVACVFHPPPPLPEELAAQAAEVAARKARLAAGKAADAEAKAEEGPRFQEGDEPELGMSDEEIREYALAQGDPEAGEFTLAEALAGLPGADTSPLWARFTTTSGTIECELHAAQTPITVANFVGLARGLRPFRDADSGEWVKRPFFAGTKFHRVIAGFMIQGGDQTGTGRGDAGYVIPDELVPSLRHDRAGVLSMANRGPTTGSAQFFITLAPTPHLDDKHTVFGRCTDDSVRVAEAIAATGGEGDQPTVPQVIETLEIVR